jgi:uracil-DNA glycosylase
MIDSAINRLEASKSDWLHILWHDLQSDYLMEIDKHLRKRAAEGVLVHPSPFDIFNALASTPYHNTRVVILGAEPYAETYRATGRAYDVSSAFDPPPVLKNIHRELRRDLGLPKHTCMKNSLFYWATQGVLLLNEVLTVEDQKPGSHKEIGWQELTRYIIRFLGVSSDPIVFMFWGEEFHHYSSVIADNHLVIKSPSPKPGSASQGFYFSSPFSRANEFLRKHNRGPIDWLAIRADRYGAL